MNTWLCNKGRGRSREEEEEEKHIKDLFLDPLCLAVGEMSSEIPEELRRALLQEPRRHISSPGTKALRLRTRSEQSGEIGELLFDAPLLLVQVVK